MVKFAYTIAREDLLNRDKTVSASLAVLMLLSLANPVSATPDASTTTTTQSISTSASTTEQVTGDVTGIYDNSETETAQALSEAASALQQTRIDKIRQDLDNFGDELESLNTDYLAQTTRLAEIQVQLDKTKDKLRWYQAEYDAQHAILENRVADIYKQGKVEPVDAIINNQSISEAFTKLSLLIRIGEQDVRMLDDLANQRQLVEDENAQLDALYAQQKDITAGLEGRKKVIEEKMQQETVILANLDTKTKELLDRLEAEQEEVQNSIVNDLTRSSSDSTSTISLKPGSVGFEALKYLGVPYVWGGETPAIGLDCSGLVKIVFEQFGVDLPHYSRAQAKLGASVGYDELQPGDLVFFGQPIHHVGIYLGDGYYIHAPKRNDVVKISRMSDRSDHAGARRIISMISAP
jgi:cell wall-associated NlpC family hydrolase